MYKTSLFLLFFLCVQSLLKAQKTNFVTAKNGVFSLEGKPYRYVGANYWYGGVLGLTPQGRKRLITELDFLSKNGVKNLRVLAAAEGSGLVNGVERVGPPLQTQQGIFNKSVLTGLDFLLAEMGKRNMKAILFLSNNWEWSGGFLQYLNWNGKLQDSILKRKLTWDENRDIVSQFYSCENCLKAYNNQLKYIVGRTNTLTNKKYTEDATIMAWELANEPRPMRPEAIPAYKKWITNTAALIKTIDKKHLLTTGSEGTMGSENMNVFKEIHADKNIDYATIHIWPKNWGWFSDTSIAAGYKNVVTNTNNYIDQHLQATRQMKKPLVLEEFGLPRDSQAFSPAGSTYFRDEYYKMVFGYLMSRKNNIPLIAGASFWAFNGIGRAFNDTYKWQKGNDLLGDPPMEEQGLNGVFDTDTSTWEVIRSFTKKLQ